MLCLNLLCKFGSQNQCKKNEEFSRFYLGLVISIVKACHIQMYVFLCLLLTIGYIFWMSLHFICQYCQHFPSNIEFLFVNVLLLFSLITWKMVCNVVPVGNQTVSFHFQSCTLECFWSGIYCTLQCNYSAALLITDIPYSVVMCARC